ncbi:CotH kinase family protein [Jidongwangia harbinensis]|uniref:CotH kinase family protein n=1 Tax=Jidongwangia harbinensis TaxID=2878561 RepID=UPI001CD9D8B6|nr:CotH kinase family protein [Jidongwangia harbinensis]MCA2218441.1 CotH kinase family protein [Jidongwangia harbinensis]
MRRPVPKVVGILLAICMVVTAAPAYGTETAVAPVSAAGDELSGDITFSVPSGTFQNSLSVTLGTALSGAQIRYTTDGSVPTATSPAYSGALALTRTTQVRAQAFANGAPTGAAGTALYVARAVDAQHDLPLMLIDNYGKGKPGREYVDAAAMVFDTAGGRTSLSAAPTVATRAGIHLRGQSSAMFEKAPYRLELRDNADEDADHPMLGMPADSDWVLRGPFSDKSLVREALVYDLGREMGMATARYRFVELYLNVDNSPVAAADYQGVYMLVETIKNNKDRLDLKELEETDTTLPKISGGYIFKFEWLAAEEPTLPCTGAAATCWNFLEVYDPSPLNAQQKTWLTQYLQQFHDMLHSPQMADPQTGYRSWIDVKSWIDLIILNEFSREMDSYIRSTYFYKDREGPITAGPLWDYDLTFGTGGFFNNNQTAGWQYQQTRTPMANDWFQILLGEPTFQQELRARWQTLRNGLLSDASLGARIDALTAPLTNAAQRNFQKWPNLGTRMVGPFITDTTPTWAGQVQVMRTWMTQRAAWLDSTAGWGRTTTSPPLPPTTTTPPPPTPVAGCTAAYTQLGQWGGGFQGEVTVTAGAARINGWTVTLTFANGQQVSQGWNAVLSSSGAVVTARNAGHNGALNPAASATFGVLGSWTGTNAAPAVTCTAS